MFLQHVGCFLAIVLAWQKERRLGYVNHLKPLFLCVVIFREVDKTLDDFIYLCQQRLYFCLRQAELRSLGHSNQ